MLTKETTLLRAFSSNTTNSLTGHLKRDKVCCIRRMLPALVDCKLSQLLLIVNQKTVIILLLVGWDARLVLTTKLAKCVGARTSH